MVFLLPVQITIFQLDEFSSDRSLNERICGICIPPPAILSSHKSDLAKSALFSAFPYERNYARLRIIFRFSASFNRNFSRIRPQKTGYPSSSFQRRFEVTPFSLLNKGSSDFPLIESNRLNLLALSSGIGDWKWGTALITHYLLIMQELAIPTVMHPKKLK